MTIELSAVTAYRLKHALSSQICILFINVHCISFGFIWQWSLLFSILSKSREALYKPACFINRLPILHSGKDRDLLYGLLIASFIHVSRDIAYSLHKLLFSISVCVSGFSFSIQHVKYVGILFHAEIMSRCIHFQW